MRIILLIYFTISLSTSCIAQQLSVKDIIVQLKKMNNTSFDSIAKANGFCFTTVYTKNPNGNFNRYESCDYFWHSASGIKTKNYASFGILTSKCISFNFGTSDSLYFKRIIGDLEKCGYSITGLNYNTKSQRLAFYSSIYKDIKLEIIIQEKSKEGIGNWPLYYIHLDQLPTTNFIINTK